MIITIPLFEHIKTQILNPIIMLLFGVALIVFLYGLVEFLMSGDVSGKNKEGKDAMLWGIIGMAIMISVYGIEELIINTINELVKS